MQPRNTEDWMGEGNTTGRKQNWEVWGFGLPPMNVTRDQLIILGEHLPPRCKAAVESGLCLTANQRKELNLLLSLSLACWSGGRQQHQLPLAWRTRHPNKPKTEMMTAFWIEMIPGLLRWERAKGPWPVFSKNLMRTALKKEMRTGQKLKRDLKAINEAQLVDLENALGDIYGTGAGEDDYGDEYAE